MPNMSDICNSKWRPPPS